MKIEIKQLDGVHPRSGKPQGRIQGVDFVLYNGRAIGVAEPFKGGGVALHETVSEEVEDEIRRAMDERDGEPMPQRALLLAPKDPRRKRT